VPWCSSWNYSKIPGDVLRSSILQIIAAAKEREEKKVEAKDKSKSKTKKAKIFTETVELQIGLKNYDPQKDKRFSGQVNTTYYFVSAFVSTRNR
jgi:hypothetical protein